MVASAAFRRVAINHNTKSQPALFNRDRRQHKCVCVCVCVCLCASCAAIGVNLSFVREIASAKGSEYNALGVQKNKKNDHRTNMGLCKDYLVRRSPTSTPSFLCCVAVWDVLCCVL